MTYLKNEGYSWVKRLLPAYEIMPAFHKIEDISAVSLRAFVEPHTVANEHLLEHLTECAVSDRAKEVLDALAKVASPRVDGKYPLGQGLRVGDLWLLKDKELKRLSLNGPEIRIVRNLFPRPKSKGM